jgi:thiamine-monophosphate kinase
MNLHEEVALHHLRPKPPLEFATRLASRGLATSMIDISDGLAADLGHIVKASGVGATVRLSKLPLSRAFMKEAEAENEDPISLALSGGEDFELLFTVAESQAGEVIALGETLNCQVTEVGHTTSDRGAVAFLDEEQRERHFKRRGFDHFRK